MELSSIKSIILPEGKVASILDANGNIIWKKKDAEVKEKLAVKTTAGAKEIFSPSGQDYRYGPSIIKNSDGSLSTWWSSPGNSSTEWDWIRYRLIEADGTVDNEQIALKPTSGADDHYSVCDPGVIYFNGYYYLGYTSTQSANMANNEIYVARAVNPAGPYEKWGADGWGSSPKSIIKYTEQDNNFGCGEPSFVIVDNKLYIYYTRNDASGYHTCLATAPLQEDWPANISLQGTVIERTWDQDSFDVAYVDDYQVFLAFDVIYRDTADAQVDIWQSVDGINFGTSHAAKLEIVHTYAHNLGMSKDLNGHIRFNEDLTLGYGWWDRSKSGNYGHANLQKVKLCFKNDNYDYDYIVPSKYDEVDILYTTDTHLCWEDSGSATYEEDPVFKLNDVSYYNDKLWNAGIPTFCVDCGDWVHGNTNTETLRNKIIGLFNSCGTRGLGRYLAVTFGNHEWKSSVGSASACVGYMDRITAMTACNFLYNNTVKYKPTRAVRVGNKKLGIVGVGYPAPDGRADQGYPTYEDIKTIDNYKFYDAYRTGDSQPNSVLYKQVQKYIDEFKNNGFDYIIAITHMDKYADEDFDQDKRFNSRADRLIKNTSGINVVIPGHYNHPINEVYTKTGLDGNQGIIVQECGASFHNIGRLRFKFDDANPIQSYLLDDRGDLEVVN